MSQFGTYEILLGNPNSVRWVDGHGRLNLQSLGARPVEGGYEANGTPLFIAQASIKGSIQPGKISEKLDRTFFDHVYPSFVDVFISEKLMFLFFVVGYVLKARSFLMEVTRRKQR